MNIMNFLKCIFVCSFKGHIPYRLDELRKLFYLGSRASLNVPEVYIVCLRCRKRLKEVEFDLEIQLPSEVKNSYC